MSFERDAVKKRYDRLAWYIDIIEAPLEGLFFRRWRQCLWSKVAGHHILEIGVGTGKNFEFHPKNARITGVDFSQEMLKQAKRNAERKHTHIELHLMDVQKLDYADNSFDTVIGTFVLASVPQPSKGLKELYRVCRPGGQVLLLEQVLSPNAIVARMMNLLNPLLIKVTGAHVNRDTVKTIKAVGFSRVNIEAHYLGLIKLVEASK